MYTKEQLKYIIFFRKMAEGKIPHQPRFYCIDDHVSDDEINAEYQKGGNAEPTIQLITPTQQQVQQAEAEIKRNIEEATKVYKRRPISRKRNKPY